MYVTLFNDPEDQRGRLKPIIRDLQPPGELTATPVLRSQSDQLLLQSDGTNFSRSLTLATNV